jgi:protein TonB
MQGPRSVPPAFDGELFAAVLVDPARPASRRVRLVRLASLVLHAVAAVLLVAVPIFAPVPLPERGEILGVLIYDPPPPPPPPLPRGSSLRPPQRQREPARPAVEQPAAAFTPPIESPPTMEASLQPPPGIRPEDQFGSETGSVFGSEMGDASGVDGGIVGGVPGGTVGGVLGATGTGPVPVFDYDSGPRLVKQTRPVYPQEAFVKKIEGEVDVEILIDPYGRVVHTRILRSVPLLDAAAVRCVSEWTFRPAIRKGIAVASIARAPVSFRIY